MYVWWMLYRYFMAVGFIGTSIFMFYGCVLQIVFLPRCMFCCDINNRVTSPHVLHIYFIIAD